MRRWLLILVVLLLPLRAVVGSAMAGQMLQPHGQADATAVHHAHAATGAPHAPAHDCEHAAPAAGEAADDTQPQAGGDCPTCASCQVCSSVALFPDTFQAPVVGFSQPPPQALQGTYASAEPLLAFKPPRR